MLVIIGLMSSAVVMSLPKAPPAAKQMAEGLTRKLNMAAQESLLSGEPFAFGVSDSSYSLLSFDEDKWTSETTHEWADGLKPKLTKDGESVKLTDDVLPFIVFEPTGTSSVFELSMSNFSARYILSSQGDGRVSLEVET